MQNILKLKRYLVLRKNSVTILELFAISRKYAAYAFIIVELRHRYLIAQWDFVFFLEII